MGLTLCYKTTVFFTFIDFSMGLTLQRYCAACDGSCCQRDEDITPAQHKQSINRASTRFKSDNVDRVMQVIGAKYTLAAVHIASYRSVWRGACDREVAGSPPCHDSIT